MCTSNWILKLQHFLVNIVPRKGRQIWTLMNACRNKTMVQGFWMIFGLVDWNLMDVFNGIVGCPYEEMSSPFTSQKYGVSHVHLQPKTPSSPQPLEHMLQDPGFKGGERNPLIFPGPWTDKYCIEIHRDTMSATKLQIFKWLKFVSIPIDRFWDSPSCRFFGGGHAADSLQICQCKTCQGCKNSRCHFARHCTSGC